MSVKIKWNVNGKRMEHEIVFGRPKSLTYAVECVGQMGVNATRGLGACLGVAWTAGKSRGAPKARLDKCGYSVAVYGGRVVDELLERGVSLADLQRAGVAAMEFLSEGIPSEVDETVDFTEANGEPSTS